MQYNGISKDKSFVLTLPLSAKGIRADATIQSITSSFDRNSEITSSFRYGRPLLIYIVNEIKSRLLK